MSRLLCVGSGHVGLPLALKFWEASHDVVLVDVDTAKIAALREGRMPFPEEGCDELLAAAAGSARFLPLTYEDESFDPAVRDAEYIILTLGTPLGTDYTFRFDQYAAVLQRITGLLTRGVTLIVRSTVVPHFTQNVVTARISAERDWVPGVDFYPSYCPERLLQGRALTDIDELPEIIGADDTETARHATELFRTLGADKPCLQTSTVEAELAKLFLNTYRYTLFGLANEFAVMAEEYSADVYAILDAANAGYPRGGIPKPGPSRGPCLGKDTSALAYSTSTGHIAHAAIKTNENLVLHVSQTLRAALGSLVARRIAILGTTFKANTSDTRDNLTAPLVNVLDREGAATVIYDPLVPAHADPSVLQGSDALIVMVAHRSFVDLTEEDVLRLCGRKRTEVFVYDLWNIWPWADRILGKGTATSHEDPGHRSVRLTYAGGHSAAS